MELREFIDVILRRLWLILLAIVLVDVKACRPSLLGTIEQKG